MITAYIGLGSNLNRPQQQIAKAIHAINLLPDTAVTDDSGYFSSTPMGPGDQPDFINAVVEIKTALSADELLMNCQRIEQQQGRIKIRHWGERSIDLDILLYGDLVQQDENLTIPHPGVLKRDFVYLPLNQINPQVAIPGYGVLAEILSSEKPVAETRVDLVTEYNCQYMGEINWKQIRES